jgi:hypothetical protein
LVVVSGCARQTGQNLTCVGGIALGALPPNIPEPRLNPNAYAANLNLSILSLSGVF